MIFEKLNFEVGEVIFVQIGNLETIICMSGKSVSMEPHLPLGEREGIEREGALGILPS